MSGLGLSSVYGIAGAQGALRQRILDQLAAEKQAQEMAIQQQEMALKVRHETGLEADRQSLRQEQMKAEADRVQGVQAKQDLTDFTAQPQGARLPGPLAIRARAQGLPVTDIPADNVQSLGGFSSLPGDAGSQGPGIAPPPLQSLRVRALNAPPTSVLTTSPDPASPLSIPAGYGRGATEADVNKTQLEARQARQDAETERTHRETAADTRSRDANTAAYREGMLAKAPAGDTSLVKVERMGPDGRMEVAYLPKSEVRGKSFEKGPSAATETRLASALAVKQTGEDIIAKLSDPEYAATVGPVLGRYSNLRDFVGDPPPEFAELAGAIESYSLGNMGVHGMRSAQGAQLIAALMEGRHDPAAIVGAIKGLNGFATHFLENEGRGKRTPTPTAGAGGVKKYNPATGTAE